MKLCDRRMPVFLVCQHNAHMDSGEALVYVGNCVWLVVMHLVCCVILVAVLVCIRVQAHHFSQTSTYGH